MDVPLNENFKPIVSIGTFNQVDKNKLNENRGIIEFTDYKEFTYDLFKYDIGGYVGDNGTHVKGKGIIT